ncbi:MAG: sugar isomerase, partial [Chitinophagaceae bacterium]
MAGQVILDQYSQEIKTIAQMDFKRIVFLGSGPLKGTARESQLKLIELTDGEITCQHESYLGFRHGPKAVLTESTLLIYLLSNQPYVNRYERDLIRSINDSEKYLFSIGIGQTDEESSVLTDMVINASTGRESLPDEFFSICSTLPAQLLGFYKSLELGLSPDSPSLNGGIH